MRFGWLEIALILVIVLIVFGVGKLPQVRKTIGKNIRAFKKAQTGEDEEEEKKPTEKTATKKAEETKAKS